MGESETDSGIPAILVSFSEATLDHVQEVAQVKRFLERWTMDPSYRDAYAADPRAALASLSIALRPDQVDPLIDSGLAARTSRELQGGNADACALAVRRYRAFIAEKHAHRQSLRTAGEPSDARLAAWRQRQINRSAGELGAVRAEAIVHAPMAIELSKGCTVGCWFCGVAAPRFDHNWPYTPQNASLWREVLGVLQDVVGPAAREGFLYWATDPLDNPEYEHFLTDFHTVLGQCPQTTTAIAHKDVARTRRLLELTDSLGSYIDRFSITSLKFLDAVHAAFTPDEMLRIECVPQNREATDHYRKSNAGRAREFATRRAGELVAADNSSTIACVSGFLFNMVEKSVKLITPCNASDRWPLGYWILAEGTFGTAAELRALLESMIAGSCRRYLRGADTVRLRKDLRVSVEDERVKLSSLGTTYKIGPLPDAGAFTNLLTAGISEVVDVAVGRQERYQVPPAETMALLDKLFRLGLVDEEPAVVPESAIPQPRRMRRTAHAQLARDGA